MVCAPDSVQFLQICQLVTSLRIVTIQKLLNCYNSLHDSLQHILTINVFIQKSRLKTMDDIVKNKISQVFEDEEKYKQKFVLDNDVELDTKRVDYQKYIIINQ